MPTIGFSRRAFCLDPRFVCIEGICAVILWLDSVLGFPGISRASDSVDMALLAVEMPPVAPSKSLWLAFFGGAGEEIQPLFRAFEPYFFGGALSFAGYWRDLVNLADGIC